MRMPTLFIGHGAPTNALADNAYTKALARLGRELPRPKAILSISAHWITDGTRVLSSEKPKTIHDFGGFPDEMYRIQYPALGAPEIVSRLSRELQLPADDTWGLDHGTWTVLKHLYPKAEIPVLQLSLDQGKSFQEHLDLGRGLAFLREVGVLILGSGNLTHNLGKMVWDPGAQPADWALEFDAKAKGALEAKEHRSFADPSSFGEGLFLKAHPTSEHYLPLLYALGASDEKDGLSYPYEGFEHGTLSMRMVQFG